MTVLPRKLLVLALVAGVGLVGATAAAQSPPPGGRQGDRGAGRGAAQPGRGPGNAEVQQMLDALVVSKAQNALQLSNEQFIVFLPKLLALQNLQRQHRNQRNKLLADIRGWIGPKAPAEVDDATILAASKALDDLEAQMYQDEQRALAAIDGVLTVRQRAHFRLFQEMMERQKIDLIVQARAR